MKNRPFRVSIDQFANSGFPFPVLHSDLSTVSDGGGEGSWPSTLNMALAVGPAVPAVLHLRRTRLRPAQPALALASRIRLGALGGES